MTNEQAIDHLQYIEGYSRKHDAEDREAIRVVLDEIARLDAELRECLYATCQTPEDCERGKDVPVGEISQRVADYITRLTAERDGLKQTATDLEMLCERISRAKDPRDRIDLVDHARRIAKEAGVKFGSIIRTSGERI